MNNITLKARTGPRITVDKATAMISPYLEEQIQKHGTGSVITIGNCPDSDTLKSAMKFCELWRHNGPMGQITVPFDATLMQGNVHPICYANFIDVFPSIANLSALNQTAKQLKLESLCLLCVAKIRIIEKLRKEQEETKRREDLHRYNPYGWRHPSLRQRLQADDPGEEEDEDTADQLWNMD